MGKYTKHNHTKIWKPKKQKGKQHTRSYEAHRQKQHNDPNKKPEFEHYKSDFAHRFKSQYARSPENTSSDTERMARQLERGLDQSAKLEDIHEAESYIPKRQVQVRDRRSAFTTTKTHTTPPTIPSGIVIPLSANYLEYNTTQTIYTFYTHQGSSHCVNIVMVIDGQALSGTLNTTTITGQDPGNYAPAICKTPDEGFVIAYPVENSKSSSSNVEAQFFSKPDTHFAQQDIKPTHTLHTTPITNKFVRHPISLASSSKNVILVYRRDYKTSSGYDPIFVVHGINMDSGVHMITHSRAYTLIDPNHLSSCRLSPSFVLTPAMDITIHNGEAHITIALQINANKNLIIVQGSFNPDRLVGLSNDRELLYTTCLATKKTENLDILSVSTYRTSKDNIIGIAANKGNATRAFVFNMDSRLQTPILTQDFYYKTLGFTLSNATDIKWVIPPMLGNSIIATSNPATHKQTTESVTTHTTTGLATTPQLTTGLATTHTTTESVTTSQPTTESVTTSQPTTGPATMHTPTKSVTTPQPTTESAITHTSTGLAITTGLATTHTTTELATTHTTTGLATTTKSVTTPQPTTESAITHTSTGLATTYTTTKSATKRNTRNNKSTKSTAGIKSTTGVKYNTSLTTKGTPIKPKKQSVTERYEHRQPTFTHNTRTVSTTRFGIETPKIANSSSLHDGGSDHTTIAISISAVFLFFAGIGIAYKINRIRRNKHAAKVISHNRYGTKAISTQSIKQPRNPDSNHCATETAVGFGRFETHYSNNIPPQNPPQRNEEIDIEMVELNQESAASNFKETTFSSQTSERTNGFKDHNNTITSADSNQYKKQLWEPKHRNPRK